MNIYPCGPLKAGFTGSDRNNKVSRYFEPGDVVKSRWDDEDDTGLHVFGVADPRYPDRPRNYVTDDPAGLTQAITLGSESADSDNLA